jgi:RNA polymerase sigma factor (sigma-70 family)
MSGSTVANFRRRLFGLLVGTEVDTSDDDLLRRFVVRADEAAFAGLVRRYGPMVLGVCRRVLADHHDAEDAFQATFLVLARKASCIHKPGSLASWLFSVARRVALQARRRRKCRRQHEIPSTDVSGSRTTPGQDEFMGRFAKENAMGGDSSDALASGELRLAIDEELAGLPPKYREPLVLCFLAGKSVAEASRQLHTPESTIRSRVARGCELLRVRLDRRGFVVSTAALAATAATAGAATALSESLLTSTARAAVAFAAGLAPSVCKGTLALATTILGSTSMTKVRLLLALLATAGLVAGAVAFAHQAQPTTPSSPPENASGSPQPDSARRDGDGDPLPAGALARLGTHRFRHQGYVIYTSFLPDGKQLLTAATDGTARLWDLATGKETHRFGPLPDPHLLAHMNSLPRPFGMSAAASADGRWVAAGNGLEVRLWDVVTGRELGRLKIADHYASGVTGIAIANDRKALATIVQNGEITLWDTGTFKEIRRFNGPNNRPVSGNTVAQCIAFSPDGKRLVTNISSSQFCIQVWDTVSGKEVRQFKAARQKGEPEFISPAFSPDGKYLAWGDLEGGVHVSAAASGKILRTLHSGNTEEKPVFFGFASDGKTLVTQNVSDRSLRAWNLETGAEIQKTGPANRAGEFTLWGGGSLWTLPHLAVSPDGKLISPAYTGHLVVVHDAKTGKLANEIDGPADFVARLMYSADGSRITTTGYEDHALRTWDSRTGKALGAIRPDKNSANQFLSPDGKVVAVIEYAGGANPIQRKALIRLCDPATGKELCTTEPEPGHLHTVVFSPDSRIVARVGPGICLYDVATGQQIRRLAPPEAFGVTRPTPGFLFSPDGKLAAGPGSRDAADYLVWDVATGKEFCKVGLPKETMPGSAAISPDGRSLAIDQGNGSVVMYEVLTGKERCRFGRAHPVESVPYVQPLRPFLAGSVSLRFSPNGLRLAHLEGSVIRVWDSVSGEDLGKIDGHGGLLTTFAFAPNGKTLTTGGTDTTCVVWDFRVNAPTPRAVELPARKLEEAWKNLEGESDKAFQALVALTASPDGAVPFLAERLAPPRIDVKQIETLIADLDSDEFAVRKKAIDELTKMDRLAVPALKKALANNPSAEVARQSAELLTRAHELPLTKKEVRILRAIEVLERMAGEKEALQLLRSLAKGPEGATATEAAQGALRRLGYGEAKP